MNRRWSLLICPAVYTAKKTVLRCRWWLTKHEGERGKSIQFWMYQNRGERVPIKSEFCRRRTYCLSVSASHLYMYCGAKQLKANLSSWPDGSWPHLHRIFLLMLQYSLYPFTFSLPQCTVFLQYFFLILLHFVMIDYTENHYTSTLVSVPCLYAASWLLV